MKLFVDRVFRLPRVWSNRELEKYAHLFHGDIVNVSGWQDIDKEGKRYRDYFFNAGSYTITNYKAEARGFQGYQNEIFLDLEQELPKELYQRFDAAFNHTTLEHIFDIQKAFANVCNLSKDIVILVLPFLQQYHSSYGDYWRFTPLAIRRMFQDNGLEVIYQSYNGNKMSSVYVFTIASRNPEKWMAHFKSPLSSIDIKEGEYRSNIGHNAISNFPNKIYRKFNQLLNMPKKALQGVLRSTDSLLGRSAGRRPSEK